KKGIRPSRRGRRKHARQERRLSSGRQPHRFGSRGAARNRGRERRSSQAPAAKSVAHPRAGDRKRGIAPGDRRRNRPRARLRPPPAPPPPRRTRALTSPPPNKSSGRRRGASPPRQRERGTRREVGKRAARHDVTTRTAVHADVAPHEAILAEVKQRGHDLIVM